MDDREIFARFASIEKRLAHLEASIGLLQGIGRIILGALIAQIVLILFSKIQIA